MVDCWIRYCTSQKKAIKPPPSRPPLQNVRQWRAQVIRCASIWNRRFRSCANSKRRRSSPRCVHPGQTRAQSDSYTQHSASYPSYTPPLISTNHSISTRTKSAPSSKSAPTSNTSSSPVAAPPPPSPATPPGNPTSSASVPRAANASASSPPPHTPGKRASSPSSPAARASTPGI